MKKFLLLLVSFSLLTSCTVFYRTIRYGSEDIDDYNIFPTYDLNKNQTKFHFETNKNNCIDSMDINWKFENTVYHHLDSLLEKTSTRSFLIIRNDTIIYEKYFNGYKANDISTVFSISKSITSLLMGIAVDEGFVSNINDPVTKYIPELLSADPMFKKLTIKHLLDMRSGLKFKESYGFNPFSKIARLYYGRNQMSVIKKMHFETEPGIKHEYQSISTAILGVVIEKATKQNLAEFFEDKVWIPLGMENTAKWSFDDKNHRSVKSYGGLSITAIDLAKIGRLYINNGVYNGKQIVSEQWIKKTFTPNTANDGYQNQWYSFGGKVRDTTGNKHFKDSITAYQTWEKKYSQKYPYYSLTQIKKKDLDKKDQKKYWNADSDSYWELKVYANHFFAQGIMSQLLYIDPQTNTIIVRLGDYSRVYYLNLLNLVNNSL